MDAKLQRNNEHLNLQGYAARSSPKATELFKLQMVPTVIKGRSCEQVSSQPCESPKVSPRSAPTSSRALGGHKAWGQQGTCTPLFEMFGFLYSLTPICFQQLTSWRREAFSKHPASYPQRELQLKSSKGAPGPVLQQTPAGQAWLSDISLLNTEKYPSSAIAMSKKLCRLACF